MWLVRLTICGAAIGMSASAFANDTILGGLEGSETVFIWKDKASHFEAMKLVGAGMHQTNPDLVLPLLSCIVTSSTQANIIGRGTVTDEVTITSGPNAGCHGMLLWKQSSRSRSPMQCQTMDGDCVSVRHASSCLHPPGKETMFRLHIKNT